MEVIERLEEEIENIVKGEVYSKGYILGLLSSLKMDFKELNNLKDEVVMLRNIIKLMINNLENKVREDLKHKELLNIFSKLISVDSEISGNDSMSLMCDIIKLNRDNITDKELSLIKQYLIERLEVVNNVNSKE